MDCIFVDKPKECTFCLPLKKIQCLLNKQHLIVSEEGKAELLEIVKKECESERRYKKISGEDGRKNG